MQASDGRERDCVREGGCRSIKVTPVAAADEGRAGPLKSGFCTLAAASINQVRFGSSIG